MDQQGVPPPTSPQGVAGLPPQPLQGSSQGSYDGTPKDDGNILDETNETDILKEVILDNPTTGILLPNSQVYNNDDNDVAQCDVNLTDINQVNANAFVHEGREMISLRSDGLWRRPDETDGDIAGTILAVADNNINIEEEKNQPNKFLVNEHGDILRSGGSNFSPGRYQFTNDTKNSVYDMFINIKIDESTSKSTNVEIDQVLTEHTGVTSILATRDNTTSTNTAEKPNAPAQMGYIWGSGIVDWVKRNDLDDDDNVCYLCGKKMEQRNGDRGTDDWDYPEVEHKIPCTTAFTLFPSMDNLRWYYPYYSVVNGETSRADEDYRRRTPSKDKSMLAWWLSFTPTTYKQDTVSRRNAKNGLEFNDKNQMSSNRFEYLRRLYISINKDRNTDINSPEYNNVKNLFKRFIKEKYGSSDGFNETVFNYSWNVICLWLMEFAGSHKTCNQRKSQYNLMTADGVIAAKTRKYNGGMHIGGSGKNSIDNAFNSNIRLHGNKRNKYQITGGIIFNHLTSIKNHYVTCCELYQTVSSHNTLKSIHLGDKIEVYKRMHIWDNFRRIISYVKNIREAYFKAFSGSSSGGINKIEGAIDVVNKKIASIDQHKENLTAKKEMIQAKSERLRQTQKGKIDTELAALDAELSDLKKELWALDTKKNKLIYDGTIICDKAKMDKKAAEAEKNHAKRALDEENDNRDFDDMGNNPKKKGRNGGGGGNYEDAVQRLRHAENELKYATSICNKACGLAGRSCDTVSGRPAAGLASSENPIRDRTGIRMQELIEGRGGTRRKRRQLKSKHTRRVRKTKRKSTRTRRLRKPSRKSKTRRRVKK